MRTLGTIQFRNGIYQGLKSNLSPESYGIYFDDDLVFHCSEWIQSGMNNHTAILYSNAKYIYGDWKDGLPHGFNVFRTGENVVLGMFQHGEVVGNFILIFQRQGYVIVGCNEKTLNRERVLEIVEKKEFKNQVQLKKIISSSLGINLQQQHFSFVKYLNSNFSFQGGHIKLYFQNGVYHFGYNNGLRVVFDDDVCISKIGNIDDQDQMCGLGVLFDKITEIGNFANGLVIKYKENQRPSEEIKQLFKKEHKRSMSFRNDFMFTKSGEVIAYLENLMKNVINIVSHNPIDTERSLNREDLNESMEYRPRPFQLSEENERLKVMREELSRSIGLPSSIKPAPYDNKTPSKYSDDIKQLHLHRLQNQKLEEPEPISFSRTNGKSREENRKSFVMENRFQDYRQEMGNERNKEKMLGGSRAYYNEPITVGRNSDWGKDNSNSQKSFNRESNKQLSKSPVKNSKYSIEKSPSRSYVPKESQVSTAHKDIHKHHTNDHHQNNYNRNSSKKLHQPHSIPQERQDDSLESPYRKHLFHDTIREHESKREPKRNSSRQYIPVSHNKTVNATKKSPQKKNKEVKDLRVYQLRQPIRQQVVKPQSFIALYKNNSPSSNKTQQKSPPKKVQVSPLKNPYYDRQVRHQKPSYAPVPNTYMTPIPPPVVYTKQPLQKTNPYLKKSQDLQDSRHKSPQRTKMLDKINKKYHYPYDNL